MVSSELGASLDTQTWLRTFSAENLSMGSVSMFEISSLTSLEILSQAEFQIIFFINCKILIENNLNKKKFFIFFLLIF